MDKIETRKRLHFIKNKIRSVAIVYLRVQKYMRIIFYIYLTLQYFIVLLNQDYRYNKFLS